MQQTLKSIRETLAPVYDRSEIESFIGIIFRHLLGYSPNEMIMNARETLDPVDVEKINQVLARLEKQEPIQYILGETSFYGLRFEVNADVLIPRNETEELVELILKDHHDAPLRVLDLGTGSGCIPVALKKNRPRFEVSACDLSEKALKMAATNARLNETDIHFFIYDVLSDLQLRDGLFDVWVSNPPYVLEQERALMAPNVLEHEPALALFVPNDDPLLFYHAISLKAKKYLVPGGKLYFEINEKYGAAVCSMMEDLGFNAELFSDLHGKARMVRGIKE
jgi:release factor glutamine methyltransferase